MIERVGFGVCVLDLELRFVEINPWLAKFNGRSVEDHLGSKLSEIVPDIAEQVEAILLEVMKTGEPVMNGIVEAATPAFPEERTFQHDYHVVRSEAGEIVGVRCVVLDVTASKHLETG